ncbi:MAG: hypothetical protein ACD_75C00305G0001 [uncultured bacterium]|nr:MAG: hypothetical protein ACD_75C00305G0001 [uncultured bacterium]
MHPVQAPEDRNGVMQYVLSIDDQVQQHYPADNLHPVRNGRMVEQSPIVLGREQCNPGGQNGEDQGHRYRVQCDEHEVGKPPPGFGDSQPPPRPQDFHDGQSGKDYKKEA